jgi:hypothetical protein
MCGEVTALATTTRLNLPNPFNALRRLFLVKSFRNDVVPKVLRRSVLLWSIGARLKMTAVTVMSFGQ